MRPPRAPAPLLAAQPGRCDGSLDAAHGSPTLLARRALRDGGHNASRRPAHHTGAPLAPATARAAQKQRRQAPVEEGMATPTRRRGAEYGMSPAGLTTHGSCRAPRRGGERTPQPTSKTEPRRIRLKVQHVPDAAMLACAQWRSSTSSTSGEATNRRERQRQGIALSARRSVLARRLAAACHAATP